MIIIDANLLIYAINADAPFHPKARIWVDDAFRGTFGTVKLPWLTLVAFVRVVTNPKILATPLTIEEALGLMNAWLSLPTVEVLHPTARHASHFSSQCRQAGAIVNLVTDAHLAALAIEHDCELASCDADFAKFPGLRWVNPIAA